MTSPRVLSIGQCFADHSAIARTLQRHFAAEVVGADSPTEALECLRQQHFDLVLVNRILDADHSSGLEVIGQLKSADATQQLPVMLVSNYDDAQQQAVDAGALPGFGKSALGHPAMLERVRAVLQA